MKQKNKRIILLLCCSSLLSGCAGHNKPTVTAETEEYVNKNIDAAITAIQQTQKELYQYGAVNNQKTGVSGGIYSDTQRIELNWNGDARQLLSQLASQRNYKFITSGVKLPLPVSLKVQNAEYREVVELIQTQIGYRAGIVLDNTRRQMILRYNSPVSQPSDGHVKIVATDATIKNPAVMANQPQSKPMAPTIGKTQCDAICGSNGSKSFFNAGPVVPERPGTSCTPEGLLGRDAAGKALSCKKGLWRRL